jgi:hypothetical protein
LEEEHFEVSGVQFWRFPDEEAVFLEYLGKTGNIIAFSRGKFWHKNEFLPMPLETLIKSKDPDRLCFCLDHHINNVVLKSFSDADGEFCVVSLPESPVISYDRGRLLNSNKLSTSFLESHWSYLLDGKTFINKPEDFIKWGKRIFRWSQKTTPEFYQHKYGRITPRVAEALHQNQIELIS